MHVQPLQYNCVHLAKLPFFLFYRVTQLSGCQITGIIMLILTPPWTPTLPTRGTSGPILAGFGIMMYVNHENFVCLADLECLLLTYCHRFTPARIALMHVL